MTTGYYEISAGGDFCLMDRGKEVEAAAEHLVMASPFAAARLIIHLDMRVNELEEIVARNMIPP